MNRGRVSTESSDPLDGSARSAERFDPLHQPRAARSTPTDFVPDAGFADSAGWAPALGPGHHVPPRPHAGGAGGGPRNASSPERAGWEATFGGLGLGALAVVVLLLALSSGVKQLRSSHCLGPASLVAALLAAGGVLIAGAERIRARSLAAFAQGLRGLGISLWFAAALAARQSVLGSPRVALTIWLALLAAVTLAVIGVARRAPARLLILLVLLGGHGQTALALAGQPVGRTVLVSLFFLNAAVLFAAGPRRWAWIGPLVVWSTATTLAFGWRAWFPAPSIEGLLPLLAAHWALLFGATLGPPVWAARETSWPDHLALTHASGAFFAALWLLEPTGAAGLWALGMAAAHAALAGSCRVWGREHVRLACALAGVGAVFLTIALALQLGRDYVGAAWCAQGLALNLIGIRIRDPKTRGGGAIVALLGGGWMLAHLGGPAAGGPAKHLALAALGTVLLSIHALSAFGRRRQSGAVWERCATHSVALAGVLLYLSATARFLPPAAALPVAAAGLLAWIALAVWCVGGASAGLGFGGFGLTYARWLAWSVPCLSGGGSGAALNLHFSVALLLALLGGAAALILARRRPGYGSVLGWTAAGLALAGWRCQVGGSALGPAWAGVGAFVAWIAARRAWKGGAVLSLVIASAATGSWALADAAQESLNFRLAAGAAVLVLLACSAGLLRRTAIRLPRVRAGRRRWTWWPAATLGLLANSIALALAQAQLADRAALVIQVLDLAAVWTWGFGRGRRSGRCYALGMALGVIGPRLVARDIFAVGTAHPLAFWRDPGFAGVGLLGLVLLGGATAYARSRRIGRPEKSLALLCLTLGHLVLISALTAQLDAGFDRLELQQRSTGAGLESARMAAYSVLWTAYAAILISVGVGLEHRPTRILGMIVLIPVAIKVFWLDCRSLGLLERALSLTAVGLGLGLASFLYLRFRTRLIPADPAARRPRFWHNRKEMLSASVHLEPEF